MVGGEYSHSTVLIRVPPTYVWPWPMLQRSYVQNQISRLIHLDRNSGLQLIGVGKVIRGIIGKAVVHTLKEDIIRSAGNLQVCAGHESGCEVAIHSMSQIFNEVDSVSESVSLKTCPCNRCF